jgi:hypothetical protein
MLSASSACIFTEKIKKASRPDASHRVLDPSARQSGAVGAGDAGFFQTVR